jgi:hypothetical protein
MTAKGIGKAPEISLRSYPFHRRSQRAIPKFFLDRISGIVRKQKKALCENGQA